MTDHALCGHRTARWSVARNDGERGVDGSFIRVPQTRFDRRRRAVPASIRSMLPSLLSGRMWSGIARDHFAGLRRCT